MGYQFTGGASLLILVGVAMDTVIEEDAQLRGIWVRWRLREGEPF
jgi:hypothetical protein